MNKLCEKRWNLVSLFFFFQSSLFEASSKDRMETSSFSNWRWSTIHGVSAEPPRISPEQRDQLCCKSQIVPRVERNHHGTSKLGSLWSPIFCAAADCVLSAVAGPAETEERQNHFGWCLQRGRALTHVRGVSEEYDCSPWLCLVFAYVAVSGVVRHG